MANRCRGFRFLLQPTTKQRALLERLLACQRELYNAALEERRGVWVWERRTVTKYEQFGELAGLRASRPDTLAFGTTVCRGTLTRLDEAFRAFYRRARAGENAGYPRFKGAGRWDSVQWPYQAGWSLDETSQRLRVHGIGANRRRGAERVGAIHRKIARQRLDHADKVSRALVERNDLIVHENLRIANLCRRPAPRQDGQGRYVPNWAAQKTGLNRSILDAGWGLLLRLLTYKAEDAGRTVIAVAPRHTSQLCYACGHSKSSNRSGSAFRCRRCDHVDDADRNAARNILRAGLAQWELSHEVEEARRHGALSSAGP